MSGLLCTHRDRLVLEAVLNERVLKRSEIRRRFFSGVSRQMADRRIHFLLCRYPEFLREERSGFGQESVLMACAVPGAASTYREHDEVLNCLRAALVSEWPESLWLPEVTIRTGAAGSAVPVLGRRELSRIPDAIFLPRGEGAEAFSIEFERTLKSGKRVLEIVRTYENRVRSPFAAALVFCGSSTISSAYRARIEAFFAALHSKASPRTQVIDLSVYRDRVGSPAWNKAVAHATRQIAEPFFRQEVRHGKAS